MVLSVAVIVIWQLTDVRIREEADLRALFDIPVLGQIPAFDQPDGRRNGALPSGKGRKDGEEA